MSDNGFTYAWTGAQYNIQTSIENYFQRM